MSFICGDFDRIYILVPHCHLPDSPSSLELNTVKYPNRQWSPIGIIPVSSSLNNNSVSLSTFLIPLAPFYVILKVPTRLPADGAEEVTTSEISD